MILQLMKVGALLVTGAAVYLLTKGETDEKIRGNPPAGGGGGGDLTRCDSRVKRQVTEAPDEKDSSDGETQYQETEIDGEETSPAPD